MSYAAFSDVVGRYPTIVSMIGSGQYSVSSAQVSSIYIADAESFVDGWLGRKYTTPVTPVTPLVTQLTSDLAIFNMLAERMPTVPDFIQKRYDRSMTILENLADGTMTLGNSVMVVSSQGDNFAWSGNMDFHPTFDPALDYIDQTVDVDRVNAAKDIRQNDTDECQ
jgi:phage gp36-like protein